MPLGKAMGKATAKAVPSHSANVKSKAKAKSRLPAEKVQRQLSRRAAIKMLNEIAAELELGVEPHAAKRNKCVGHHEAGSPA